MSPEAGDDATEPVSFVVGADESGQRLDRIVVRHLGAIGRRGAGELFRSHRVRVDGRIAKKGDTARASAVVTLALESMAPIDPEPDLPLDVRFERADLVVVHKPAGVPTAPLRPGERGTLAGALLGRYPELEGVGHRPREPGLLHRLDTQTSGLVIAARTERAFEHLSLALSEGRLEKKYLAVVSGALPEAGRAEHRLGPDPRDPRRVAVHAKESAEGRASRTDYRRVRAAGGLTLVEASASPAYRHQVRAHLAALGHPIVGDALYGGALAPSLPAGRHALHASYVAWAGDDVAPAFSVLAALPDDLAALLPA